METVTPLNLDDLQREMKEWQDKNFPNNTDIENFLGVVEEVGELAHSILKKRQGIRGTPEQHDADSEDAVADIAVFLLNYCNKRDWSLNTLLQKTWETVRRRDWQKNRMTGSTSPMCPVCGYVIPPDRLVPVGGVAVHMSCAATYAREHKS